MYLRNLGEMDVVLTTYEIVSKELTLSGNANALIEV